MSRTLYDYPALYDAVHLPDTPGEAEGILAVIERHRPGARRLLEPACGTGRFLEYFSERGFAVEGYDLNARAVAFAKRRLKRISPRINIGDMRKPGAARPGAARRGAANYDAAYSVIGTFRHLLSDRDALAHLRRTAEALVPGGVYVVGLDLVDYADCPPDEEGWEVARRGRTLRHIYQTLPPTRRRRRERVINFLVVSTARGDRVLQDDYELRSYDLRQWKELIARSPFTLAGTYDSDGRPSELTERTRYALFALVKE